MMGGQLSIIVTAILILFIGLVVVMESRDLIRMLIGLELMFNSVFFTLVALYAYQPYLTFLVVTVSVLTSAAEFIALIMAILTLDRLTRSIRTSDVTAGGESGES